MDFRTNDMDFYPQAQYYHIMASRSAQLLMSSELPQALDAFAACFDLRITVFDEAGERIVTGGKDRQIPYCLAVKRTGAGMKACRDSDTTLFARARADKRTVSHVCHGGLLEVVHPVYVQNVFSAYIMLGQIALTGHTPKKNARLLAGKRSYTDAEVKNIIRLFEILVRYIVDHRLLSIRTDEKFELVMDYLRAHFREQVTIDDVAALVGLGKTAMTNLFRSVTGKTFKETLIGMRLDEADRLMREFPEKTVREIAIASGYQDPLFFSRSYRQMRGRTPSEYRAQLHAAQ